MQDAGQEVPKGRIIECAATREQGFLAAQRLFKSAKPPTGIVCFNDLLAFGVMLGLRSIGVEPGLDCSVVGADDVAEAALWKPGLTTVAMHSHRIGQNAGSLFHKRQEMPATGPEQILLKPELIVRGSSCLRC